jgi:hypothetical protein
MTQLIVTANLVLSVIRKDDKRLNIFIQHTDTMTPASL